MKINFIDLKVQQKLVEKEIKNAIDTVLEDGSYIFGKQVKELETGLSKFTGSDNCISCGNGTDALLLALMSLGMERGDTVFVPTFTFTSTAEMVALAGGIPYFIDVDKSTFNIDPDSLENGIKEAIKNGNKVFSVIVVDLFGQPVNYNEIESICKKYNLYLISDAAQSLGASYGVKKVGNIGDITTTSFFPAKPLGCYGDGGAVFTNNNDISEKIISLRSHGKSSHKYENIYVGMNSRLDTIQAAILIEKLKIFKNEINERNIIANKYSEELKSVVCIPQVPENVVSVWAQYTIKVDKNIRSRLVNELKEYGIPTAIYYPKPLHKQEAYKGFPCTPSGLSVSEILSEESLSLPMHPYLKDEELLYITDKIKMILGN